MEGEPESASPPIKVGAGLGEDLQKEVVRLRTELDRVQRVRARRTRRIATTMLAVITTISVIASTVAFWGHRTVFDQDHYMNVVGPLGEDPAVTGALYTYLGDQIVTALDLKTRITDALKDIPQFPDHAVLFIGPIAGAVANSADNLVRRRISEFVASQDFPDLWVQLNRVSHRKVVALLRGDYKKLPNLKVDDAEVRLDLLPIVSRELRELVQDGVGRIVPGVTIPDVTLRDIPDSARQRISGALGVTLPPNFGEITIMSKQKLTTLQAAVNRFDRLVWGMILLSILLGAATVVVAADRRRGLVELAVSVIVGLLVAAVAIRIVKEAVVDRIKSGQAKGAARVVMDNTLGSLRAVAVVVLLAGIVVAVLAHLAGRPRWLIGSTRWIRTQAGSPDTRTRIADNADGLRIAIIALGLLALFFTGLGVLAVLLVGGVVGTCLWGLERVKPSASPDSTPSEVYEDDTPVGAPEQ